MISSLMSGQTTSTVLSFIREAHLGMYGSSKEFFTMGGILSTNMSNLACIFLLEPGFQGLFEVQGPLLHCSCPHPNSILGSLHGV
jgi:hypothetical protein